MSKRAAYILTLISLIALYVCGFTLPFVPSNFALYYIPAIALIGFGYITYKILANEKH